MCHQERVAAEKLSVAESAPAAAQAVGRVLGSLCVLTARDGDAESAMLASWVSQVRACVSAWWVVLVCACVCVRVSACVHVTAAVCLRLLLCATDPHHPRAHVQASFDPPGLTVAVKKDRAVEGLLLGGAKFVLNVLAENKEKVGGSKRL